MEKFSSLLVVYHASDELWYIVVSFFFGVLFVEDAV
jgi:hypothetical protein